MLLGSIKSGYTKSIAWVYAEGETPSPGAHSFYLNLFILLLFYLIMPDEEMKNNEEIPDYLIVRKVISPELVECWF
jgi:hypothetical protein